MPRHRSIITSLAWQAAQLGIDAPATSVIGLCVTAASRAIEALCSWTMFENRRPKSGRVPSWGFGGISFGRHEARLQRVRCRAMSGTLGESDQPAAGCHWPLSTNVFGIQQQSYGWIGTGGRIRGLVGAHGKVIECLRKARGCITLDRVMSYEIVHSHNLWTPPCRPELDLLHRPVAIADGTLLKLVVAPSRKSVG